MTLRKGIVFEQEKLLKPLQKVVFAETLLPPPQRIGRDRIRAGRAAEPEIDAAGKQRLEHLEAFSHHERRVVGQHDTAGTHPHALGRRRDLPDHDLGCGTRDRRQVVMFGDPIARVAKAVGEPREVE